MRPLPWRRAFALWRILLGFVALLPALVRGAFWVLGLLGSADFVISRANDPGWVGGMLEVISNPPGWLVAASLVVGFAFFAWELARARRMVPRTSAPAGPNPADCTQWAWVSINRCCFLFLDKPVPTDTKLLAWELIPPDAQVMARVLVGLARHKAVSTRGDPEGKTSDRLGHIHTGSYIQREDLKVIAQIINHDPKFLRQ